jgi:hypothetical protein
MAVVGTGEAVGVGVMEGRGVIVGVWVARISVAVAVAVGVLAGRAEQAEIKKIPPSRIKKVFVLSMILSLP